MEWSEKRDKLAAALVKAQAQIRSAEKTAVNPSLRNQYADIDAVWTAIRTPLVAAELAVIQAPTIEIVDGVRYAVVITEILHSSGQWCRHECRLPVPGGNRGVNDAQAAGVAVTYARRYSILGLLSVAGEHDTDGHVSRHDPSWKADRKKFCAALKDQHGVSYEALADHLEASGRIRPSEMTRGERERLWRSLPGVIEAMTPKEAPSA